MTKDTLYSQDFAKWVKVTVEQLKQKEWEQIDLDNLVNEVEGLTKQEQRELRNHLKLLLWHLLKWEYQPQKRSRSWEVTIEQAQEQIADILEQSPSLKQYLENSFISVYKQARSKAKKETGLPLTNFPEKPPMSLEEVLTFIPNPEDNRC
jgi:predicted  nucleic acid-binding Zn-ribbon protein